MVGTLQDHGPLENDPVISGMIEVTKLYPHLDEPDFIVSLGTGEPAEADNAQEVNEPGKIFENGGLLRLGRLAWEKSRDKKARQIFVNNPRYLRFDVKLPGSEPRLDSLESMDALESLVDEDASLAKSSEDFARRAIATLFYFELAHSTDYLDGKYEGQGYILCKLYPSHPAFQSLMNYLHRAAAKFYLNDDVVANIRNSGAPIGPDGRFRLLVKLRVANEFNLKLRQGDSAIFHISASPLSVKKLETLQGLTAYFGRPNHRKRQRSQGEVQLPSKKIRRLS